MAELDREPLETGDDNSTEDRKPSYEPASFEKRAAAWTGVAYMLMILGVFWFALFFPGRELSGTFPLFLIPVCAAVIVVTARRLKLGTAYDGAAGGVVALIVCAAGIGFGLLLGVPALIAAFAG